MIPKSKVPQICFKGFSKEWEETKLYEKALITMGQSPASSTYNENLIGLPLIQGNADCKDRKTAPRIFASQFTKECFEDDIEGVLTDLDRNMPWWSDLCEDHQRVMANMAFNLGINRLLKFKKFLGALQEHDFETAAVEMMDSKWATQVGPRATRLRDRILKGEENA